MDNPGPCNRNYLHFAQAEQTQAGERSGRGAEAREAVPPMQG